MIRNFSKNYLVYAWSVSCAQKQIFLTEKGIRQFACPWILWYGACPVLVDNASPVAESLCGYVGNYCFFYVPITGDCNALKFCSLMICSCVFGTEREMEGRGVDGKGIVAKEVMEWVRKGKDCNELLMHPLNIPTIQAGWHLDLYARQEAKWQ